MAPTSTQGTTTPQTITEEVSDGGGLTVSRTPAVRPSKRALLIAYHYPPCGLSSGLQRSLCFSRDLGPHGWSPLVLTVKPYAFQTVRTDQLDQVPPDVAVRRVFALDTTRHLAIAGRYFGWMALPDPWITWAFAAIPTGLRMIRKYRPEVIWSTYPIATAHIIGLALHRFTGVPWVADFRDPMTEIDPVTGERFPGKKLVWKARRWIEEQAMEHCARAVFVTPGALAIYRERYPNAANRMATIANGYDEENFDRAQQHVTPKLTPDGPLVLLHSGVLYPGPDRDPSAFFAALASLQRMGTVSPSSLRVRLRATGYDDYYRKLIEQYGVGDIVSLEPALPYQEALAEMLSANGLLVFQGRTSNPAVPAKLYEYLRAQRPIFALVDSKGDTAAVLGQVKSGAIVPLDASDQIAAGLAQFLSQVRAGTFSMPTLGQIHQHSRKYKAQELASLFDDVARETVLPKARVSAGMER